MAARDDRPDADQHDPTGTPEERVPEPEALLAEVDRLRGLVATADAAAADSPERVAALEHQVRELRRRLQASRDHAGHLTSTLQSARDQLVALRDEVDRLSATPQRYGRVVTIHDDTTVTVVIDGRQLRVAASDDVALDDLEVGAEVLVNEQSNIVAVADWHDRGELVTVIELVDPARALVSGQADDERVVTLSAPLREMRIKGGDTLLVDLRGNLALDRIARPEVERLVLEEVPDVTYEDIGGLADQVEAIRDAVELPYLHPDLFAEHDLKPPKGVLLYGPPGCGKTMIAKAVARSLAQRVAERTGRDEVRSHFLNVKGPELLNKYVGETERQLRMIFQRAREKAAEGFPVIVFFDEMESLFRTRGSGVSSDMETTIVPQLLAEIDGVEALTDVLIIGASNREDLIDPAILRPGRLDVKIKVSRPDAAAAREIFGIYLHAKLPLAWEELARHDGDAMATVAAMVDAVVEEMYSDEPRNRFLEVTYASGDKDELYFRDFNSGAMIANIVDRAKKSAIKRFLETGEKGLATTDLTQAIREEFRENEDLPNTTNPDDWARISGRKGERIVYIRTLTGEAAETSGKRIETMSPGQYL
jgi:proteasome-associated ATPase